MMDNIEFQLYEKRIDSCWATVEKCAEGTWAKDYWKKTAMLLLRKMNQKLNEVK